VTCDAGSTVTIELDSLKSQKTLPKKEQQKMKVKPGGRKRGSGRSSTDSVNSGSGPDYQIYIPLGWAPWVRVAYSGQTQKRLY
jgi:hypothetical protein